MKVSKENHIRAAVAEKGNATGGILYHVPGGKTIDLQKQLCDRDRAVRCLYNIFNQIQVGNAPKPWKNNDNLSAEENLRRKQQQEIKINNYNWKKVCSEYVNDSRGAINRILFYRSESGTQIRKNEAIISKMQQEKALHKFEGGELKDFVMFSLRRSLVVSKYNGHEFDSSEAVLTLLKNIGNKSISNDDRESIIELANLIRDDFTKLNPTIRNSEGAKIVRSVRNQNMVVQPKDGSIALSRVSNKGKKTTTKATEKAGLDSFLRNYPQIKKADRDKWLTKLRNIVELYFAAPKNEDKDEHLSLQMTFNEKCDADVWSRHENAKSNNTNFVSIPAVLQEAFDNRTQINVVDKKKSLDQLKADIRKRNIACYRFANAVVIDSTNSDYFFEDSAINQYFIHHIENAVERILRKCDETSLFKLRLGYLSEKVWKDILNLLSVKYVAIGKAVYHFAMDDMWDNKSDMKLGKINEAILQGISSFDYEMIKAQEDLQREMAVSVAFSANNLARVACDMADLKDNESDFLIWKSEAISKHLQYTNKGETLSAIMQFFGGMSSWDVNEFQNAYDGENYELQFLDDLRKTIYAARNESFHFKTAVNDEGSWNTLLFGSLFEKEAATCLMVEKNKFYSNNLPMFYKQEDLRKIMDKLYGKEVSRASQVPAYNTVITRKDFPDFIGNTLGYKDAGKSYDSETRDKWYSACYYLFKEVYYNLFLQSDKAYKFLENAVKNLKWKDKNQENAVADFKERFEKLKREKIVSISSICQAYMTDYNQQNNKDRKVRSANSSPFDKAIYQHYKMLLKESMKQAFAAYINDVQDLNFVKAPLNTIMEVKRENFLTDWTSSKYNSLVEDVKNRPELQKWYIVGKFLNAKRLNLLIGSMRSYIQYVGDVQKRANGICKLHVNAENLRQVEDWIKVLEVCLILSDRISDTFTDYFKDSEEYANFLSKYVNFDKTGMPSNYSALMNFSDNGKVDLYVDAENPKLNRNMIQAKLYAPDSILENVVNRVNEDDISEFCNLKNDIAQYKNKGLEVQKDEQENILKYQKLKNKVELRNLAEYGELINELLGQLINWSFMRERDLLYFQLGFHYNCLLNDSEKPESYKCFTDNKGTRIDNFILYQIVAMYVYGYEIYTSEESESTTETKDKQKSKGTGTSIGEFCKWAEKIESEKYGLYNAGLELFEVISEHDNIIDLRNKIDHFRYYQGHDSILSMYGEVFDRFFTYDMKYQKNVVNTLENVLLRHNVIIKPRITTGKKKVSKKKEKDSAAIEIDEISSDKFTYKIKNNATMEIEAKNKDYLETVSRILYYPDNQSKAPELVKSSDRVKVILNKEQDNKKDKHNHTEKKSKKGGANKTKKEENNGFNQLGDALKKVRVK